MDCSAYTFFTTRSIVRFWKSYLCLPGLVLQVELEWLSVSAGNLSATIPGLKQADDRMLFGISATVDGISSGIQWATCIVERVGKQSYHLVLSLLINICSTIHQRFCI